MISDLTVSVFYGVKDSQVKEESNIGLVLLDIQNKYQSETEFLRSIPSEQIDKKKNYKNKLSAVTFSGTFNGSRGKDNIKNYNPIIVLDIDKLDNETLFQQQQFLIKDEYVYACWVSPSGAGIKGLVPVSFKNIDEEKPDVDINHYHKEAFKVVSEYFFSKYNIELDKSGSDIPRLCFLSHDPFLHKKELLNFFSVEIEAAGLLDPKQVAYNSKIKNDKSNFKVKQSTEIETDKRRSYAYNRRKMQQIVKYLEKRKLSITENYKSWIYVAFALSSTFPYVTAQKYYLRLCRLDGNKHDEKKSSLQFDSCYRNNKGFITFRTVIYYAKEKGYYGGHREESTVLKVSL